MRRYAWRAAVLAIAALGSVGCATTGDVRYVYQDGEYGVVGLPRNTSDWPTHYRKRAESLMAQHFPKGYEIIRAEEVVEGSRVLTQGGTNSAMLDPGGGHMLNIGKMGRTSTRNQADTVPITECRIVYKRVGPGESVKSGDYAEKAAMTPALYVDPNVKARAGVDPRADLAAVKKGEKEKAESHDQPSGVVAKDGAVGLAEHAEEKP